MTAEDLRTWMAGLDDLFARVAGRFGRVEPRQRARAYLLGLLAPVERKNGWQLAEAAGDDGPEGMQRLLNSYTWDADAVRDDLRAYVVEKLGDADGVLIVDETGFVKKGDRSAGVQRQYSGTAGRIENCQVGVFVAYSSARGRALIDRELYLPKSWTTDQERCAQAAIPDSVVFATKPVMARAMLERTLAAGVPARWITADEGYGGDYRFRSFCERHGMGYVVAVPCSQSVGLGPRGDVRADSLIADAPPAAWKRMSAGDGAKGPRLYDWALARLPWEVEPGFGRWLLVRRSITKSDEMAFYFAYGPRETSFADLVRIAGMRWAIEECFQQAKTETGLDHYQVRRYDAWYRHITLAMLAHAYLAATAAGLPKALTGSFPSAPARSAVCWHT
ncbi:IS701 family transposase [Planomonospora venezuelensis]|uniref:IS701 family transposase n=1 Tax=Planomonospora venezuelensis TaxID=1999 RepID=UPI00360A212A